jgi:hypothetical protein
VAETVIVWSFCVTVNCPGFTSVHFPPISIETCAVPPPIDTL